MLEPKKISMTIHEQRGTPTRPLLAVDGGSSHEQLVLFTDAAELAGQPIQASIRQFINNAWKTIGSLPEAEQHELLMQLQLILINAVARNTK